MTSPIPIASGDLLTPARLNPPPWTSYAVQWTAATTNPTLGNGTLSGLYRYMDASTVQVRIRLDVGSTSTFGSGQYRFSLPVPAVAVGPDPQLDGAGLLGGALYKLVGWSNTGSGSVSLVNIYRSNINTQENLSAWTNTLPVALAAGHSVSVYGFYYVA